MTDPRPPDAPAAEAAADDVRGTSTEAPEPAEPATVAEPANPAEPATPTETVQPAPPSVSPYASLSIRAVRLVPQSFELLARATGELRRASFYVGLIALLSFGPLALLIWRAVVELPTGVDITSPIALRGLSDAISLTAFVALGGLLVAFVESRAIAILVLAASLDGRPLAVRDALQRARAVFWRVIFAAILVSLPIGIVQRLLEDRMADLFRGTSEISILSAALLAAAIGSPLAYVLTGVVLGDVGPVEAARRSIRLFRARKSSAVVVALFALAAEFLTVAGLFAGLDLIVRAEGLSHLASSESPIATVVTGLGIAVFLFAIGTLMFTVTAIALVPQVVMFVALTHVAPGLDLAREGPQPGALRFRWLTRPFIAVIAVAVVAAIGGLLNVQRSLS